MARRRISGARIKVNRSYTVEDLAEATGVTEPTVRAWLKGGLNAFTEKRPTLILGCEAKHFLAKRDEARKCPMPIGKLFCFRCKGPRAPALDMADYVPLSDRHGLLVALCAVCEGDCRRIVSARDLPGWRAFCQIGGNSAETG